MKLIGNLKKQVEKAETKEEMKSLIENAGMLLNDDELRRSQAASYNRCRVIFYRKKNKRLNEV